MKRECNPSSLLWWSLALSSSFRYINPRLLMVDNIEPYSVPSISKNWPKTHPKTSSIKPCVSAHINFAGVTCFANHPSTFKESNILCKCVLALKTLIFHFHYKFLAFDVEVKHRIRIHFYLFSFIWRLKYLSKQQF